MVSVKIRHASARQLTIGDAVHETDIAVVTLGLSGASLSLDVSDKHAAPTIDIDDIDAASWWLSSVLGADVAVAAMDAWSEPIGFETDVAVDAFADAPLASPLRRLALALWIKRWWPTPDADVYPIAEWLVDVEAGALAYECDLALDADSALARLLLEPHLPQLAAESQSYHALVGEGGARDALAQLLRSATQAALDMAATDAAGYSELSEIDERLQQEEELFSAGAVDNLLEKLLSRELAYSAGDSSAESWSGRAPVDPQAVTARILSTANDAIRWRLIDRATDALIEVVVDAPSAACPQRLVAGELFAIVQHDGEERVVVLTDRGESYEGETWLDPAALGHQFIVTVTDRVDGRALRTDRERVRDRTRIKDIVLTRQKAARARATGWAGPLSAEERAVGQS